MAHKSTSIILEKGSNYWILPDGKKYPVIAYYDGEWLLVRKTDHASYLPTTPGLQIISIIEMPEMRK